MKKGIRDFFREILELMFQAAALVIDTIRTFFLVVLAILGPIAFATIGMEWLSKYTHTVDMPLHTVYICGCPCRICSVRYWAKFRC